MTIYEMPKLPEDPQVTVWDQDGDRWEPGPGGAYENDDHGPLIWAKLLDMYGPLSDVKPIAVGETVTVRDEEIKAKDVHELAIYLNTETRVIATVDGGYFLISGSAVGWSVLPQGTWKRIRMTALELHFLGPVEPGAMVTMWVKGQPVPKGRPRVAARGGKVRTYTPERTRAYETLVNAAARTVMFSERRKPFAGPIAVFLDFHLSGGRRADVDNLAKAVLDALNGIVFDDDRQVELLSVRRFMRASEPGVRAVVFPVDSGG